MASYIAYRAQQRPGYESDRFRLMLYDRKTGEKKNLTEKSRSLGWHVRVVARFQANLFRSSSDKAQSPIISFAIDRPCDRTITVDGDPKTNGFNADVVVRDAGTTTT